MNWNCSICNDDSSRKAGGTRKYCKIHKRKRKGFEQFSDLTSPTSIRKRLIQIRGHKCEICKLTTWMGADIPIQVHHIDGNHENGEETNLQLVCANCHCQTENYGNKKRIRNIMM